MKPLTLVLPCYNESKSISNIVSRVLTCVEQYHLSPNQFRLMIVENGSKDNSREVIQQILSEKGSEYIDVIYINQNEGYGNGIFQGLKAAKTAILAWTHSDEQCNPADVFAAWQLICKNPHKQLIKGRRYGRKFGQWFISRMFEVVALVFLWKCFHEINAQPKVFDAELVKSLTNPPKDFKFDLYVLIKAKEQRFNFTEITVKFPTRKHGVSNWAYSFRSKIKTILGFMGYIICYRFSGAKNV